MLVEVLGAAVTALGGYNVASWVAKTGIQKRRRVKQRIQTARNLRAAAKRAKETKVKVDELVEYVKEVRQRVKSGDFDKAKLRGALDDIKTYLDSDAE